MKAIIVNSEGLVVNIIELDANAEYAVEPGFTIEYNSTAQIGWVRDGDGYRAPEVEEMTIIPSPITARQFFIAAGNAGLITKAEAIAAASTGAVPVSLEVIFESLPEEQEYIARVTWARMTTISRDDQLLVGLGAVFGLSSADIDNLFIEAATF